MKKIFLVIATVTCLTACNNDSTPGIETKKEIVPDSSQYKNTVNTDTAKIAPAAPLPAKAAEPKEAAKNMEKKTSTKKVTTTAPVATTQSPATATTTETKTTTSTTTPAVAPKKKGMSSSTKGVIIGAGAGAVGGAIISKKKGKGAIIGSVLGAGAGYIIGKKKDKKDTAR